MTFRIAAVTLAVSLLGLTGNAIAQTGGATPKPTTTPVATSAASTALEIAQVRKMVGDMGYAPTDIPGSTSGKFQITLETGSFTIPLGIEISPSKRYIWLTANLGENKLSGPQAIELLKRIGLYQPTMFWITSKNLINVGATVENREVTAALLKQAIDKISGDIGKASDVWQYTWQPPATTTP